MEQLIQLDFRFDFFLIPKSMQQISSYKLAVIVELLRKEICEICVKIVLLLGMFQLIAVRDLFALDNITRKCLSLSMHIVRWLKKEMGISFCLVYVL